MEQDLRKEYDQELSAERVRSCNPLLVTVLSSVQEESDVPLEVLIRPHPPKIHDQDTINWEHPGDVGVNWTSRQVARSREFVTAALDDPSKTVPLTLLLIHPSFNGLPLEPALFRACSSTPARWTHDLIRPLDAVLLLRYP